MKKVLVSIATALLCMSGAIAQHGKYVGGDISLVPSYETHNSAYLDTEGNKIDDLIGWLKNDCGWNTFRVRIFVNPKQKAPDGKTDPAVCQDLEYVKALGKRIKEANAYFMLDFHYSDTWVDAGNIQAPEAWKNLSVDEKTIKIAEYTKETLQALIDAGAKPNMVQVGNEIMYGFMGIKVAPYDKSDSNWEGYLKVLKAGCEAVRETTPDAQIIIHTDRPSNSDYAKYYYGKLDTAGVPYDVIGLSYYPFWHGTLAQLTTALSKLKSDFPNKKVQIVESGYYFQYWPTAGVNTDTRATWPASPDGQYNFVNDLVKALANYDQVEGLSYWCPEDAGNGDDTNWNTSNGTVMSGWTNRGFWDPNTSKTGHKPIVNNAGKSALYLFKDFLDPYAASLQSIDAYERDCSIYNILGQRITKPRRGQLYIINGKKVKY